MGFQLKGLPTDAPTSEQLKKDDAAVAAIRINSFPFENGEEVKFLGWFWQPAEDDTRDDFSGYIVAKVVGKDNQEHFLSKKCFCTREKKVGETTLTSKGVVATRFATTKEIEDAIEGKTLMALSQPDYYTSGARRPIDFGTITIKK